LFDGEKISLSCPVWFAEIRFLSFRKFGVSTPFFFKRVELFRQVSWIDVVAVL
jgi:hypothetical protein